VWKKREKKDKKPRRSQRGLLLGLLLCVASLSGMSMRPEEIEALMNNRPAVVYTIPGKSHDGDDPIKDLMDGETP
jgi:hypothetical protein